MTMKRICKESMIERSELLIYICALPCMSKRNDDETDMQRKHD